VVGADAGQTNKNTAANLSIESRNPHYHVSVLHIGGVDPDWR